MSQKYLLQSSQSKKDKENQKNLEEEEAQDNHQYLKYLLSNDSNKSEANQNISKTSKDNQRKSKQALEFRQDLINLLKQTNYSLAMPRPSQNRRQFSSNLLKNFKGLITEQGYANGEIQLQFDAIRRDLEEFIEQYKTEMMNKPQNWFLIKEI